MTQQHPPTSAPGGIRARLRRLLAVVLSTATASLAAVAVVPAGAQSPSDPATAGDHAATWLAGQLVDGERLETVFGGVAYPDQGLTADAVFAFAAAGVAETQAAAATAWLGQTSVTDGYVGDGTSEIYVGATAKLALVAQVRGLDPTNWGDGGVDLVARLLAREQGDGRFTDLSSFGDFSNPIGQALAIIVLVRQPGVDPSANAIDRLLAVQCADGGFASQLDADPTTCVGAVDQTAFALQALIAAARPGDADDIAEGLDFLEAAQNPNGGFGTTAGSDSNANSTGVAAQALAAGGRSAAAAEARSFLVGLQVGCAGAAADRGAVAFDSTGLDDRAARATAQAIPGLAGVSLADLSAAGASTALPSLDCTAPTTTTTTVTPPPTTAPSVIGAAPVATPVAGTPSYTG